MSYTTHVRMIQSNPYAWYSIVEKTIYSRGAWSEVTDGDHILTMDSSGTSGMLRFKSASGDSFLVALRVYNYRRWCDIVVDSNNENDTGVQIHPTYYTPESGREDVIWKEAGYCEKRSSRNVNVVVIYYQELGNSNYATVTISGN